MTRIEYIQSRSIEDLSEMILGYGLIDGYCKSDCEGIESLDCPHEKECCMRWLAEQIEQPSGK